MQHAAIGLWIDVSMLGTDNQATRRPSSLYEFFEAFEIPFIFRAGPQFTENDLHVNHDERCRGRT